MDNKDMLHNEDLLQDEALEATEIGANADAQTLDNEAVSSEIEGYQTQITELKNKILYQQAEFDNFRKRTMKERSETIALASRDTLTAFLPILDDFDRASKNETFTEGVNLLYQKMLNIVKSKGLKEMDSAAGSDFDVELHEAITEIPAGDDLVGKVVDTVEKGYFLNDKLIRHAKVVVGR